MAFFGGSTRAYTSTIGHKTGVFQPVTGQAVVVQTTAADDDHAAVMYRASQKKDNPGSRFPVPEKEIVSRVESHTICFKKKGKKPRNARGAACDLPVFSALNGMSKREILDTIESVGVVQTPVNPNDKTKPIGFRTNATRIGGTVSTINTGNEPIEANVPVYWDVPHRDKVREDKMNEVTESECGQIKGHPQGIIYAATRAYKAEKLSDSLVEATIRHFETNNNDITDNYLTANREVKKQAVYGVSNNAGNIALDPARCAAAIGKLTTPVGVQNLKRRFAAAIESRNRIIGWSLNCEFYVFFVTCSRLIHAPLTETHADAAPGEQLDLILKK